MGGLKQGAPAEALQVLEQVAEQTPASLWTTDRDLVFTWASGRGLVVPPSSIVGKTIVEFLGPEFAGQAPEIHHRAALEGRVSSYELRWKGFIFDIHVSPLRTATGEIVGVIGTAFEVTEREKTRALLEASQGELQRLARQLQTVREDEQRRISREIHDQLGSMLSLFRVQLTRLREKLSWRQRGARSMVDELLGDSAGLLTTVRRIAAELRPPVLENVQHVGLTAALRFVAEDMRRRTGLVVNVDLEFDESRVDRARAETAYHAVREALTNSLNHAEAVRAMVAGRILGDELRLEILDDGKGILPHLPGTAGGLGMTGIGERLRAWGGSAEVQADAGGGARVLLRLPLAPIPVEDSPS